MNTTENAQTGNRKLKGCLKSILYVILGCLVLLLIIGFCTPEDQLTSTDETMVVEEKKADVKLDPYIKGFDPYATNLALKEYGFKTDRDFSLNGKSWTAERDDVFIKYSVLMFSPDDHEQITSYRLTIAVEPGYENISKGKKMMQELSGVKYDGNDAAKAYEWVGQNYNKNNASIDIGGVRFAISAPSDFIRILNVNKINPETGDIFY